MKEKKGLKISMILTLIGVVALVTGITFAIYENTINASKNHVIKTGIVNFTLTETTNGILLNNLQELTDFEGMAQEDYYEFNITNTGDTKTDYEIYLIDKNSTSYTGTILDDKYVKVGLLIDGKEKIVNLEEVNRLIETTTIKVGQTVNYKLRIWLNFGELTEEQKEVLVGQKIFLNLKVNGIQNIENELIGADTLIALTDNKDESGLYTITHEADSTLQIGATESITEYRYRGASPKNYVTFNNETWRIIGVFPVDDGTGNIENRIKIIKDQSIGNKYWNTSSSNNWTGATLKEELNGTYYNGLDNTSQSMIGNTKYYLGGYNSSATQTPIQMYSYERKISGSSYYYGSNPNSWVGKIGLMYASDYGFSAGLECIQTLYYYNNSSCKSSNWLYNGTSQWLLPQRSDSTTYAFYVDNEGRVSYGTGVYQVYNVQLGVRPVLYLTSDVQITGGSGTSSSPYTLGR